MHRVLLVALLCSCVHLDRAALASSTAALACDWGYTRSAASDGWRGFEESNPVLGRTPSPARVDAYFAIVAGLNTLAWFLTPPKLRAGLPAVVTAQQADAIANNRRYLGGVCGL
jgi:hypothetical protein